MENPLELVALTEEVIEATANRWREHAGIEEFEVECSALFDACRQNPAFAHALVRRDSGDTEALLEIVDTPFSKSGSVSKLLKVWISPEHWASNSPSRDRLVEIYSWAYIKVISTGMYNRRDTVKIYGRNDVMLDVLRSLKEVWNTDVKTSWTATMAGRWLVLTKE